MNEKLIDAIASAYDAISALEAGPELFNNRQRAVVLKRAVEHLKAAWKACGLTEQQLSEYLKELAATGRAVRWDEPLIYTVSSS